MPWSDHQTALNTAVLGEFAEPAVLARTGGRIGVIHHPAGERPAAQWDETGLDVRLSDQPAPYAEALAGDITAVGLLDGDPLSINGTDYMVDHIQSPDDAGWQRIGLMPARIPDGNPGARWQ